MRAIINARIYDYVNYIENGYVVFDKKIVKVGKMIDFKNDNYKIIDAKGAFLIPGLVCAHSHIYSIFARGLSLPFNPLNFQEILDQMWWKIDHHITNEITYYSGIAAAYEFMLNGVTTIIDHHASGQDILKSLDALKKAVVKDAGLRGIFCFETSDRYDVNLCVKENVRFIKSCKGYDVGGLFGLHASSSLSEATLKKVSKALHGNPIHIHVAESTMDVEDAKEKYNSTIIERLDKHGLINENSLLVHNVHSPISDLEIIKRRNALVVINTTSNMNNAVGLPSLDDMKNVGVDVLIGNDGLSSQMATEFTNALYTGHLKSESPIKVSLNNILESIKKSYDYVSNILNISLGRIEDGYEADFLLLPYSPITPIDNNNAFGHLFYGLFQSFKPSDVFSKGNWVVKDYKVTSKSLIKKYNMCSIYATKLHKSILEGE